MSELTLFKGGVPAYLKEFQDETTDSLSGGELGQRRISLKGGVFREMIGSKEYRTSEDRAMNVIIIKAAPKNHRTYFAGSYVEGQASQPTCWSADEVSPAPEVPDERPPIKFTGLGGISLKLRVPGTRSTRATSAVTTGSASRLCLMHSALSRSATGSHSSTGTTSVMGQ